MNLQTKIERLLAENRKSPMSGVSPRDSDKELIIQTLQVSGANLTAQQVEVLRSINFESVRRTRQKLQEEGKYLPSAGVKQQRKFKSLVMQQTSPALSSTKIGQQVERIFFQ